MIDPKLKLLIVFYNVLFKRKGKIRQSKVRVKDYVLYCLCVGIKIDTCQ